MFIGGSLGGAAIGGVLQNTASAASAYDGPAGSGGKPVQLSALVTETQRVVGRVDSTYDARTKQWLNEAQEEWQRKVDWELLKQEEDFTLTGGQDFYLPPHVRKVNWVFDVTNKRPVFRREEWQERAPSEVASASAGEGVWWREVGMSPVTEQPAAASQVFFDPEGAETVVCHVQGLVEDTGATGPAARQHPAEEFVTCITGAETSGSRSFLKIFSVGKSTLTESDVVVRYASAGRNIARIGKNTRRTEYRHLKLLYVPPAGTSFRINYSLRLPDLVDDNQILPPGVDPYFLIYRAASRLHKAEGDNEGALAANVMANEVLDAARQEEYAHGDQDDDAFPDSVYWNRFEENL